MKEVDFSIKDLLSKDQKFTFLVGAGCSVDPPSCLAAGHKMMNAIIDYTCAKSELKKIKKLDSLRFEALVEIVRDLLDSELKLIEYYGECDKPNIQHFFLAEVINKGHFVMTTNFDFLIEYALIQSDVPRDDIIPVITREDFEKFKDPNELFNHGKKTVYKIHGSTKNIITGKSTKDSLMATIRAFGLNKEGKNVFAIEPFKRPLFDNISKDRTLVVMGYSGNDDFDVVPTLKVLENIRDIIWINYKYDDSGREKIYEFDAGEDYLSGNLEKTKKILFEMKRMNNTNHVYQIDVNTTRLVKDLISMKPDLSPINFELKPMDWLKDQIKSPSRLMKFQIPYKIYSNVDENEDALRCAEKALIIAEESGDQAGKAINLNNIGAIYYERGNYPEALKRFEEALRIDEQRGDLSGKAIRLNNIGRIFQAQGNYSEALKRFEEALRIDEQLEHLFGKAIDLDNIGTIYYKKGNYPEALKRFEEALRIAEQQGDLSGKAIRLNNIGEIYRKKGNYPEALKRFEEALRIDEQLRNLSGKAIGLNNIGVIYYNQGNYPEALERYEEALRIDEQLGNLPKKAIRLNNIGWIYKYQGNYSEALKRFEESLKIYEQLKNKSRIATHLRWIGTIYAELKDQSKAIEYLERAFAIYEELGLNNKLKEVRKDIDAFKV